MGTRLTPTELKALGTAVNEVIPSDGVDAKLIRKAIMIGAGVTNALTPYRWLESLDAVDMVKWEKGDSKANPGLVLPGRL